MALSSLTAFAKTHGATRQAAAAWRAKGALKFVGKLIDVEASDLCMRSYGLGRFNDGFYGGKRMQPAAPITSAARAAAPGADVTKQLSSPWRTDNPCSVGVQIEQAAAALAAEFGMDLSGSVARRDLSELADDVMLMEYHDRCEAAGWWAWPETAAAMIAEDLGIPGRASDVRSILERLVVARLVALDREPDDFTDPTIERR